MTTTKYERLSTNRDSAGKTNEDEIEMDSEVKVETIPKKHSSSKVIHFAIGSLGLILLYLSLSICLTFYQRWLLKDLKFPLSIVLYHLIIKLVMSTLVRYIYKLSTGKSRVLLDWKTSLKKISPTGLASGIDIGFSNWGLELVNISLYTMTKSTTIVFILFFAILLGLERKSWSLVLIVVMIAGGLFMFTYKSTHFDAIGFAFILFASFTSGIRWSFAQVIMQKSKIGLHNPVDMIFHMQPWMILSIVPFTLGFEGKHLLEAFSNVNQAANGEIMILISKLSFGAIIAFLMEISEFLVLSQTSSLTLSITGIFKDMCQVVLAVELYDDDQLSPMNILGLILCLCGIGCHIIHKYTLISRSKNEDTLFTINKDTHLNDIQTNVKFRKNFSQSIPLLDSDEINNSDSDVSHNSDNQNASEVIFDILKRRDATRR